MDMKTNTITGRTAIIVADMLGIQLHKAASPTDTCPDCEGTGHEVGSSEECDCDDSTDATCCARCGGSGDLGSAREITADEAILLAEEAPALVYVDSDEVAAAIESERIVSLREEAAGRDDTQVALCDAALDGSVAARVECARAIASARAQADS